MAQSTKSIDITSAVQSLTLDDRHSEKKNKDYRAIVLKLVNGREYFIFLSADGLYMVEQLVKERNGEL